MAEVTKRGTFQPKSDSLSAETYPLSIVIPAYNAAGFLRSNLEALARNDLSNTEILVVDDASEDDTAAVVESFSRCLPVRLLRLPRNVGPAAARNRGAEATNFLYLLFLDADIQVPDRALFWFRDTLDLYSHRPDVAGVLGTYSERAPRRGFLSDYKNLTTSYLYRATDTWSPFCHTAIVCLRREVFESVGGFDETLRHGEDFKLGAQLGSRGFRLIIDRRIQAVHLKTYTWSKALREDWDRVQSLSRLELDPAAKRFSWRAHRWSRLLSLAIPPGILICLSLGIAVNPHWHLGWLGLAGVFLLLHQRYLRFLRRRGSFSFALQAAFTQLAELTLADLALIWSLMQRITPAGRRKPAGEPPAGPDPRGSDLPPPSLPARGRAPAGTSPSANRTRESSASPSPSQRD